MLRYIGVITPKYLPMTQHSTPTTEGPSAQTLEFLKNFARTCGARPQRPAQSRITIVTNGEVLPLGYC